MAADAIYSLPRAGLTATAGPAVTALLIIPSVLVLFNTTPTDAMAAFLAGLALMAGVRSFTGVHLVVFVRPNDPDARPFFDEINVARAFDLPVDWTAWSSSAVGVFAWIVVVPRLTPDRWLKIPAVVVGSALSIFVGAQIGPFLLP